MEVEGVQQPARDPAVVANRQLIDGLSDRVAWLEAKADVGEDVVTSQLARLEKVAVDLTRAAQLLRGLPLLLAPLLL